MVVKWKGYEPKSAAALAAAAAYRAPAGIIEEGYPSPTGPYISGYETEDTPIAPAIVPQLVAAPPVVAAAPVAFNGIGQLPGIEEDAAPAPITGEVEAAPALFPLVAPVIGATAWLSFGFLKRFAARWGMTALKALIGVAAFKEFMDMLGLGAPDDAMIKIRKNGKRRYSIGSNPRVGTLQKVSRHCQRLLKRHEKVIREFLPKKAPRYGIPPSKALSAIEKAAIRGTA